jgi:magnesium-transporting ATPase (P-type)
MISIKLLPFAKRVLFLRQKKRTLSYRIKVGDLVFVDSGSRVPVDMIVLATSNSSGVAFMETAPLDGYECNGTRTSL